MGGGGVKAKRLKTKGINKGDPQNGNAKGNLLKVRRIGGYATTLYT